MSLLERIKQIHPSPDRWSMRDALVDLESGGQQFARSKTLIQEALHQQGYMELANKMANCKPSRKCCNPYCDSCQRDIFLNQRQRFQTNLSDPYSNDEAAIREHVVFVTALHELVPFDQPESGIIRFPLGQVKAAMETARKQFKAVRRSFNDQIKFVGAFELEAVNGLLVKLHPVKGQVLADMTGREIHLADRFVLVHSHFLVDLGDATRNQLRERLKKEWPTKKQVVVDPLYKDVPVNESLCKLADYPFKFPVRYYLRFNEIGLDQDVVVEGKTHNLNRAHEPELIAEMVKAAGEIGTNTLTIRMGASNTSAS